MKKIEIKYVEQADHYVKLRGFDKLMWRPF